MDKRVFFSLIMKTPPTRRPEAQSCLCRRDRAGPSAAAETWPAHRALRVPSGVCSFIFIKGFCVLSCFSLNTPGGWRAHFGSWRRGRSRGDLEAVLPRPRYEGKMVAANASRLGRAGFQRSRGGARQTPTAESVLTQAAPGAQRLSNCRRGACGDESPSSGLKAVSSRP